MNNTKWKEILQAFYDNECKAEHNIVRWRTKDKENGYLSEWDATWTHFGTDPQDWKYIEYLQIELTPDNRDFVLKVLKQIHVPGEISDNAVTIYGYRTDCDYI